MQTTDLVEHAAKVGEKSENDDLVLRAMEDQAKADFCNQAKIADANAICKWASMVPDYSHAKGVYDPALLPRRYRTFTEVMNNTLELGNAPDMTEVFQVLLNAANGFGLTQVQAQDLLTRMAQAYADFEVKP
jgi:hypothetical protein